VTKNAKLLIVLALTGAAIAAYWMLVLAPKREQLAELDSSLASAKVELSQAQSTLATYERAKGSYKANYATLVRLGKAVPADDDVRSLVVQLDSAAERSGVDFDGITVGGGGGGGSAKTADATGDVPPGAVSLGAGGFTAMPFKFTFEGEFDSMSSFFSRLERFVTVSNDRIDVTGRLLRLESLSLTSESGSRVLTAEIGASSYLLPSGQGVTGGGTPAAPAPAASKAAAPAPGNAPTTPPTTTATATGALR
jgi:hypothetical protein